MATATLMSAEEFARMSTAENEDYELVDGELIPLASASPQHNFVIGGIERSAGDYFEKNPIGGSLIETDCRIDDGTVRRPDLSIFLGDEWDGLDMTKAPIPFAPSIAVEVLSPSEHILDVTRKVRDYLAAGSKEVWLLDHANGELHVRTEDAIRLFQGDDIPQSPLLPGFAVKVSQLLATR